MLGILRFGMCVVGFCAVVSLGGQAFAHGDVAPQPIDTSALPDIGEEWLEENPYREPNTDLWHTALQIGASGYNQNCARCHGLEAVSGGLAPDLRYLEANWDGDEWYVERFRNGYTQNGITRMPGFEDLLDQKAAWAIRTYIEARPEDDALEAFNDRLVAMRADLREKAAALEAGVDIASFATEIEAIKAEMAEIADQVLTASEAPVADSVPSRVVAVLDGTPGSLAEAAQVLTIGLSAAE